MSGEIELLPEGEPTHLIGHDADGEAVRFPTPPDPVTSGANLGDGTQIFVDRVGGFLRFKTLLHDTGEFTVNSTSTGIEIALNAVAWSKISGKPTTVDGFGITDGYTMDEVDTLVDTTVAKNGDVMSGSLSIEHASAPNLTIVDTDAPTGKRGFRLVSTAGSFLLQKLSDAGAWVSDILWTDTTSLNSSLPFNAPSATIPLFLGGAVSLNKVGPTIDFHDSSAGANVKRMQVQVGGGKTVFNVLDDAYTEVLRVPMSIDHATGRVNVGSAAAAGAELEVHALGGDEDVRIQLRANASHIAQLGVSTTQAFLDAGTGKSIGFYTSGTLRMQLPTAGGMIVDGDVTASNLSTTGILGAGRTRTKFADLHDAAAGTNLKTSRWANNGGWSTLQVMNDAYDTVLFTPVNIRHDTGVSVFQEVVSNNGISARGSDQSHGWISMEVPGSSSHSGYFEFHIGNTRYGYFGHGNPDGGYLQIVNEGTCLGYNFSSRPRFNNQVPWDKANLPIDITTVAPVTGGGLVFNGTNFVPGIAGGATIADSAPATPQHGQLWWESDTGAMFIRYNDGDSAQWVQISGPGMGEAPTDSKFYTRQNGTWAPFSDSLSSISTTAHPAVKITASLGSWSTAEWATVMQLTQGQGIHWLSGGAGAAGFIGFTGNNFHVMTGVDALNGTGSPASNLVVGASGATVNGSTVITTANLTNYFTMRKISWGQQGQYGIAQWSGDIYGPPGCFMSSFYAADTVGGFYVYYMALQWHWAGSWYTIQG